jgi:hypothetical protein
MKHLALIAPALALLAYTFFPHNLIGNWSVPNQGDAKVSVEFKSSGEFKVTTNGQVENQGHFDFKSDTITLTDANCGPAKPGKYKLQFYTEDSVAFHLVSDSCTDRASEVNGATIVRLRPAN